MSDPQQRLPIFKKRDELVAAIRSNKITIVSGEAGSGKSTQVPQYIYDDCLSRGEPCRILCGQPRRLAALAVAGRVAEERSCRLGGLVGFQLGRQQEDRSQYSKETRILFCTTGILVRRLASIYRERRANDFTHVILDEAHERSIDNDISMTFCKFLLVFTPIKIIVMSATLDQQFFAAYFSRPIGSLSSSTPNPDPSTPDPESPDPSPNRSMRSDSPRHSSSSPSVPTTFNGTVPTPAPSPTHLPSTVTHESNNNSDGWADVGGWTPPSAESCGTQNWEFSPFATAEETKPGEASGEATPRKEWMSVSSDDLPWGDSKPSDDSWASLSKRYNTLNDALVEAKRTLDQRQINADSQMVANGGGGQCCQIVVQGFVHPVRVVYVDNFIIPLIRSTLRDSVNAESVLAGIFGGRPTNFDPLPPPYLSFVQYDIAAHLILVLTGHSMPLDPAMKKDLAMISNLQNQSKAAILVFLPGKGELDEMDFALTRAIRSARGSPKNVPFKVVKIHGHSNQEVQRMAFEPCGKSKTKIVLATNVAETSVTIPDVVFVIDFCLQKESSTASDTNVKYLRLSWSTQESMIQRQGRAGRVRPGMCFRMVPESFAKRLRQRAEPEIRRLPLEDTILHIVDSRLANLDSVLTECPQPPLPSALLCAKTQLIDAGALTSNLTLTPLGVIFLSLPCTIPAVKVILLSIAFGCLREGVLLAAVLSHEHQTVLNFVKRNSPHDVVRLVDNKQRVAVGVESDVLCEMFLLDALEQQNGPGELKGQLLQRFVDDRQWISDRGMRDVFGLLRDIQRRLVDMLPELKNSFSSAFLKPCPNLDDRIFIVKLIIAAAYYPEYGISQPSDYGRYSKFVEGLRHAHRQKTRVSSDRPLDLWFVEDYPAGDWRVMDRQKFTSQDLESSHGSESSCNSADTSFVPSVSTTPGLLANCIVVESNHWCPEESELLEKTLKRAYETPADSILTRFRLEKGARGELLTRLQFDSAGSAGLALTIINRCKRNMTKQYPEKTVAHHPGSLDFLSICRAGAQMVLDMSSLNSTVVETCAAAASHRVVVSCREFQNGRKQFSYNTTLLPAIRGCPELLLLLFGRRISMIVDGNSKPCGVRVWPNRAIVRQFTAAVDCIDLSTINKIRVLISAQLCAIGRRVERPGVDSQSRPGVDSQSRPGVDSPSSKSLFNEQLASQKIQQLTLQLFRRYRPQIKSTGQADELPSIFEPFEPHLDADCFGCWSFDSSYRIPDSLKKDLTHWGILPPMKIPGGTEMKTSGELMNLLDGAIGSDTELNELEASASLSSDERDACHWLKQLLKNSNSPTTTSMHACPLPACMHAPLKHPVELLKNNALRTLMEEAQNTEKIGAPGQLPILTKYLGHWSSASPKTLHPLAPQWAVATDDSFTVSADVSSLHRIYFVLEDILSNCALKRARMDKWRFIRSLVHRGDDSNSFQFGTERKQPLEGSLLACGVEGCGRPIAKGSGLKVTSKEELTHGKSVKVIRVAWEEESVCVGKAAEYMTRRKDKLEQNLDKLSQRSSDNESGVDSSPDEISQIKKSLSEIETKLEILSAVNERCVTTTKNSLSDFEVFFRIPKRIERLKSNVARHRLNQQRLGLVTGDNVVVVKAKENSWFLQSKTSTENLEAAAAKKGVTLKWVCCADGHAVGVLVENECIFFATSPITVHMPGELQVAALNRGPHFPGELLTKHLEDNVLQFSLSFAFAKALNPVHFMFSVASKIEKLLQNDKKVCSLCKASLKMDNVPPRSVPPIKSWQHHFSHSSCVMEHYL